MKKYWTTLNEREQYMVIAAAICLIGYLSYILIFSPLSNAVNSKTVRLLNKKDTLSWLEKNKNLASASASKSSLSSTQLLSLISTQLKESSFKGFSNQIQQTSSGDIQISFERVPLKLILSWLESIYNKYNIQIKTLEAERTESQGIIKLSLTLTTAS